MAGDESTGTGLTLEQPDRDSKVIDDANFSHQRRLAAIHDAHSRVMEVRNAVEDELIRDRISELNARRYYRGAVEALILEVLPVLESDEIPLEKNYAEGIPLGRVTISPPEHLLSRARANINRLTPGATVPEPVTVEVVGLRDVLEKPSPLVHSFSLSLRQGRDDVELMQGTSQSELPRGLLDRAVQEATQALEEADMGLDIGEQRPRNSLGKDGKYPWQTDEALPHEIRDAVDSADLSGVKLVELIENAGGEDDDE